MGQGGWIHKRRSSRFTKPLCPISLPLNQLRPHSRLPRARTGKSEVDGSDPPFFLPGAGAGVLRHSHLPNTPWGVAPIAIVPRGKASKDTLTGKMGCMSTPDLHKERLEALRKQAVERLRARRAYRCPSCGYRSFQRDCPRCGETCETASWPPS